MNQTCRHHGCPNPPKSAHTRVCVLHWFTQFETIEAQQLRATIETFGNGFALSQARPRSTARWYLQWVDGPTCEQVRAHAASDRFGLARIFSTGAVRWAHNQTGQTGSELIRWANNNPIPASVTTTRIARRSHWNAERLNAEQVPLTSLVS